MKIIQQQKIGPLILFEQRRLEEEVLDFENSIIGEAIELLLGGILKRIKESNGNYDLKQHQNLVFEYIYFDLRIRVQSGLMEICEVKDQDRYLHGLIKTTAPDYILSEISQKGKPPYSSKSFTINIYDEINGIIDSVLGYEQKHDFPSEVFIHQLIFSKENWNFPLKIEADSKNFGYSINYMFHLDEVKEQQLIGRYTQAKYSLDNLAKLSEVHRKFNKMLHILTGMAMEERRPPSSMD